MWGASRKSTILALLLGVPLVSSSFYDNPVLQPPPEAGTPLFELEKKWGTDFGFSGISTFAHLKHIRCLTTPYEPFDIAIIGAPFDTSVSYRPGARFGPKAIRSASGRQTGFRSFNQRAHLNPYTSWPLILDCGDIPISPFDNALALHQMESAYLELLSRRPLSYGKPASHVHPKLITLGGDHSVALPALRALRKTYKQPIAVLHFDAHLDTWYPKKYPSAWIDPESQSQADFNHGSMFWIASNEGLIQNSSSVHAGLRTRLSGTDYGDYDDDSSQGFLRIECDDIDTVGVQGIIDTIMSRMGTTIPVYLSVDIDVLDPGIAPGTGTPEPGGWTTRELIKILRGIEDLNLVGGDVVEVSPSYDDRGEGTALAGAQVVFEMLTSMVKKGLKERDEWSEPVKPGQDWKAKYMKKSSTLGGEARTTAGEIFENLQEKVMAAAAEAKDGLSDRIKAAVEAFEQVGNSKGKADEDVASVVDEPDDKVSVQSTAEPESIIIPGATVVTPPTPDLKKDEL